jgi:hypothetical protein
MATLLLHSSRVQLVIGSAGCFKGIQQEEQQEKPGAMFLDHEQNQVLDFAFRKQGYIVCIIVALEAHKFASGNTHDDSSHSLHSVTW